MSNIMFQYKSRSQLILEGGLRFFLSEWVEAGARDHMDHFWGFYGSEWIIIKLCNFCLSGTVVHPCCVHCWVSLPLLAIPACAHLSGFEWSCVDRSDQGCADGQARHVTDSHVVLAVLERQRQSKLILSTIPPTGITISASSLAALPAQGRKWDFWQSDNQTSFCLLFPLLCLVVKSWSAN